MPVTCLGGFRSGLMPVQMRLIMINSGPCSTGRYTIGTFLVNFGTSQRIALPLFRNNVMLLMLAVLGLLWSLAAEAAL